MWSVVDHISVSVHLIYFLYLTYIPIFSYIYDDATWFLIYVHMLYFIFAFYKLAAWSVYLRG
jgi:hypothetical protein